MSVLYIVLPLALFFAGAAVMAFIWAARQGQFDDLLTPSMRILDDSVLPAPPPSPKTPEPPVQTK